MAKKLKIMDEKKEKIIKFDERMETDGKWLKTDSTSDIWNVVKGIPYHSSDYLYYLATDNDEIFILYRCKQ